MTLAPLFVLAAVTSAPAAEPDARLEALVAQDAASDWYCAPVADWCIRIDAPEAAPHALLVRDASATHAVPLPSLPPDLGFDGTVRSIWPGRIVSGAGGTLYVGVVTERRTMYSGGGAHDSTLTLYRIDRDGRARPVLEIPWEGGALIRACFTEADYETREGACHDEYTFSATLEPAAGGVAGAPWLRYVANATEYPDPAPQQSRAKRQRERETEHVADPKCTFSRTFRADPVTGEYAPDQPLPACGNFTDPP